MASRGLQSEQIVQNIRQTSIESTTSSAIAQETNTEQNNADEELPLPVELNAYPAEDVQDDADGPPSIEEEFKRLISIIDERKIEEDHVIRRKFLVQVESIVGRHSLLDFERCAPKEIYEPIVQRIVAERCSYAWLDTLRKLIDNRYYNDVAKHERARIEFLMVALDTYIEASKDWEYVKRCTEIYKELLSLFNPEEIANSMLTGSDQCLLTSIVSNNRFDILEYVSKVSFVNYRMHPGKVGSENCQRELNKITLTQQSVIFLNRLTNMCITPHTKEDKTADGQDAAKKYGFLYYNIKDRDSDFDLLDPPVANEKSRQNPADVSDEEDDEKDDDAEGVSKPASMGLSKEGRAKLNPAEREAESAYSWMQSANFVVGYMKDWTVGKLKRRLKRDVAAIKDKCSVVIVFLMAHGSEGYVQGIDRKLISLEKLEDIINKAIPEDIPKILILQSCRIRAKNIWQRITEIAKDLLFWYSEEDDTLHTTSFIRVMSVTKGKTSERNIAIPLFVEELKKGLEFVKAYDSANRKAPNREGRRVEMDIRNSLSRPVLLDEDH